MFFRKFRDADGKIQTKTPLIVCVHDFKINCLVNE